MKERGGNHVAWLPPRDRSGAVRQRGGLITHRSRVRIPAPAREAHPTGRSCPCLLAQPNRTTRYHGRLPRVKHVGLRGSSVAERGHASPSVPGSSPGRVRRLREASTARNHSGRWKAHRTPKCATRASGGTGRRARLKSGCPVRGVRVRIPPGPRDTEGQVPGVQARQRACAERATGGPHGVVHQRAGGGVEALPGFGPEGVTLLRNRGLQGPQPRG